MDLRRLKPRDVFWAPAVPDGSGWLPVEVTARETPPSGTITCPLEPNSRMKASTSTPNPTMAVLIDGASVGTPGPGMNGGFPMTKQIGNLQSGANQMAEVAARTSNIACFM